MKFCVLWLNLFADMLRLVILTLRSRNSLAAENLFLRKQLAIYQERGIKPRRISDPTRLTLRWLSRWFDWRGAEPASECALRKAHRDPSVGVPRLDYSIDRGPSATNPVVVATALQSRPATHIVRTRLSGSAPSLPRAGATSAASLRPAPPRGGEPYTERTSPRVQPLGPRGMMVVVFLRTTVKVMS
jgi:hypothetical protein